MKQTKKYIWNNYIVVLCLIFNKKKINNNKEILLFAKLCVCVLTVWCVLPGTSRTRRARGSPGTTPRPTCWSSGRSTTRAWWSPSRSSAATSWRYCPLPCPLYCPLLLGDVCVYWGSVWALTMAGRLKGFPVNWSTPVKLCATRVLLEHYSQKRNENLWLFNAFMFSQDLRWSGAI